MGQSAADWKALAEACRIEPGREVELQHFDAARTDGGIEKADAEQLLADATRQLADWQDRFFAQADRALLVVLQAIDAAGKDGTIKHVMSGVNPQGIDVHSFKAPSSDEQAHDYLWRHLQVLPALGRIAIFNRSYYENVLVVRVHPELLWPKTPEEERGDLWSRRFREINAFERYLVDNGTVIVKLFLNVSRDEQRRRFLARIDDPAKNWKFSSGDVAERAYWDDYQRAFSHMLSRTSTAWAPWHVVPADHKWFSHLSTSAVLLETMRALDPHYPVVDDEARAALQAARRELVGAPAPDRGPGQPGASRR